MTIFRFHRGMLDDSMETCVEVKDKAALLSLDAMKNMLDPDKELCQEYYGYDGRIGWRSYIIYQKDGGVFGFSNGKIPGVKETKRRNK